MPSRSTPRRPPAPAVAARAARAAAQAPAAPAAPVVPAVQPARSGDGYHHGALREALIQATDQLLAEQGVPGFSLREAARRAGVSPAAPAHHFGSAAGLLSEVARLGFDALADGLQQASGHTPEQRLRAQGLAYVRFALDHPGRFALMFSQELLHPAHPGLAQAADRALALLEGAVRHLRGLPGSQPLAAADSAQVLAAWSVVHGFAHLARDGKLAHLHPPGQPQALLQQVLPQVLLSLWPDRPPG